jgi:hypothetical protein
MDSGIEIQGFVVTQSIELWKQLYEYFKKNENRSGISLTQLDILRKMSQANFSLPSEKQSKILYQLYERAVNEGAIA